MRSQARSHQPTQPLGGVLRPPRRAQNDSATSGQNDIRADAYSRAEGREVGDRCFASACGKRGILAETFLARGGDVSKQSFGGAHDISYRRRDRAGAVDGSADRGARREIIFGGAAGGSAARDGGNNPRGGRRVRLCDRRRARLRGGRGGGGRGGT